MDKIRPLARQLSRSRWLSPAVIVIALCILGGMIFFGARQLRDAVGHQIVHRDAELLGEVATLEQIGADAAGSLAQQLEDASGQMALVLRLSRVRPGVLATRLFDARGRFVAAMPVLVKERDLTRVEAEAMVRLEPSSCFEPAARLTDHFLVPPQPEETEAAGVPLLSVLIPLHAPGQTNLLATAELIQDGRSIARELTLLNRHLAQKALLAFILSGSMMALALSWAFWRLQIINARLQEHAADLRRANQELALAAKTSALGAVAAHILHGLTSPLAGLQNFVATRAGEDAEWKDALRGTEKMQAMVGEIVRVLGEQSNGTTYELSLAELAQIIRDKIQPVAAAAGLRLESSRSADGALSNRDANLALLILENLLRNAIQATPPGRAVRLDIRPDGRGVVCEVGDEGPGLPASVRDNLFMPCRSTKPGGNGLGLALSRQLARHLGAELELTRSTESGCLFALILPQSLAGDGRETVSTPAVERAAAGHS